MEKWITRILAALFTAFVLTVGILTLAPHVREYGYAIFKKYTTYLPKNPTVFDNLAARVSSFEGMLNNYMFGKEAFQSLNAKIQYALGKQMLSFGESTMVTLKGGQLYDLYADDHLSEVARELVELKDYLEARGIPMLFVYAHTSVYEDDQLPVGVVDYGNAGADKILSILREGGVETLDSREFLKDAGLSVDERIYYTDFHWTVRAALVAAQEAAKWLMSKGIDADTDALAADAFEARTEENIFLGKMGQRVGAENAAPEDFTYYVPAYDTQMTVTHNDGNEILSYTGSFEETVLREDAALARNGDGYSTLCYDIYGPHAARTDYENANQDGGRVMVLKDSFGTPAAALLSLSVRSELATDQRKSFTSAQEYVAMYQPEAVVIFYCQEMLRNRNYAFVD